MFTSEPAAVAAALDQIGFIVLLPGEIPASRLDAIADALLAAPVEAVEVVPNGPHALETVSALRRRARDLMLIGAGRVESVEGLDAVQQAGAQFASSATDLRLQLVGHAKRQGFFYIPTVHAVGQTLIAAHVGCLWQKIRDDIDVEGLETLQARVPQAKYIVNQIPVAHLRAAYAAGARLAAVNDVYIDAEQAPADLIRRARRARRAWLKAVETDPRQDKDHAAQ